MKVRDTMCIKSDYRKITILLREDSERIRYFL